MSVQPDASFHRRPEVFGGGPTLLDPRGDPMPPYEVTERLKAIDDRLSIEWVPGAWGVSYFGLFERWKQGDPRWQRVQTGEIPESKARDLIQMFPRECPAYEMAAYVENRWGYRALAENQRMMGKVVEDAASRYEQAQEANIDRVVESSVDRLNRESAHALRVRGGHERAHPMVSGADFTEPKRLIPVEPSQ